MSAQRERLPEPALAFRPIRASDNPGVAALIRTVLPEFGGTGEGCVMADPELDSLYETYQLPGSAYFVIEQDGKIVGGSGIAPLKGGEGDTCELQKLYLLPSVRGLGLGIRLTGQCLAAARQLGYRRCYLETFPNMPAAHALYEKCGFQPIPGPLGNTGHFQCTRWYLKDIV